MSKIFDCFMFFNELDLLEIRLNILDPYVDYFVIGESKETFSGKPKPLYFLENRQRFARWNHKIIHVIPFHYETDSAFERAGFQKEFLKNGLTQAQSDDIVYFGDLDEIWKPQVVDDKVYNLKQQNYSYFLNNRSSENWVGTIVGKWETVKTNSFNYWRATHTNELDNGGWHFTNIGGVEQIKQKLDAYDHQEYNTLENQTLIEERMRDGEDYAGRTVDWQGKPFSFHTSEVDLPQFILDNKDKYKILWK